MSMGVSPGEVAAAYAFRQESAKPEYPIHTYECVSNPLVVIIQDDQVLIVGRDGSVKRVGR
jgi:hypothetical protein